MIKEKSKFETKIYWKSKTKIEKLNLIQIIVIAIFIPIVIISNFLMNYPIYINLIGATAGVMGLVSVYFYNNQNKISLYIAITDLSLFVIYFTYAYLQGELGAMTYVFLNAFGATMCAMSLYSWSKIKNTQTIEKKWLKLTLIFSMMTLLIIYVAMKWDSSSEKNVALILSGISVLLLLIGWMSGTFKLKYTNLIFASGNLIAVAASIAMGLYGIATVMIGFTILAAIGYLIWNDR